jgi:hypothetical protein
MDKSTNFDSSHKSGVEGSKGQSSGSCAAAFLTVYVRTVVMHRFFTQNKMLLVYHKPRTAIQRPSSLALVPEFFPALCVEFHLSDARLEMLAAVRDCSHTQLVQRQHALEQKLLLVGATLAKVAHAVRRHLLAEVALEVPLGEKLREDTVRPLHVDVPLLGHVAQVRSVQQNLHRK